MSVPRPQKAYVGYMFRAGARKRIGPDGLEVVGAVTWTLAGPPARSAPEHLAAWDKRGYKMGVLVTKGQRIDYLAYARQAGGEIVLRPDAGLVPDLDRALGTPPGYEWLGFVFSEGRRLFTLVEPNVVEFQLTVRIAPAQRSPQLVPVASRHVDGTFTESHMPGLWVLPGLPG
jgi:hypothetical protein